MNKDPKMIAQCKRLAYNIIVHSHTESVELKNFVQYREWAWSDALHMESTALSYLSSAIGERKYFDIATKLWWKITDYLYNKDDS